MLALSTALLSFAPPSFSTPTIEIAPGVHLPLVGIGTWQYNDSVTEAAVLSALSMGYEHIDTAAGYANAEGVAAALEKSGRARASYFVTSKIPGGLNESTAAAALDANLAALRLTYVDLMLVHFPATWGGEGGKAARQAEWAALEAFVRAGKARAIGVSHYCRRHLEEVLQIATLKPAINQVTAAPRTRLGRQPCVSRLCPRLPRLWPCVLRLQPRASRLQPSVSRLQPRVPGLPPGVLRPPPCTNQVEFQVGMGTAGPLATDDRAWMQQQAP